MRRRNRARYGHDVYKERWDSLSFLLQQMQKKSFTFKKRAKKGSMEPILERVKTWKKLL